MRAHGVVHTSTSEVYGNAQRVPIDEEHRVIGQSPYSASKIGADHIAPLVPPGLRAAGGGGAALQHLWSAPIESGRDSDDHFANRAAGRGAD